MNPSEPTNPVDLYNELGQPGYFLESSDESYRLILAALDQGWQVEEPVYFRPQWHTDYQWVYHFILKKHQSNRPHLVTARYSPAIERLIFEEGWQVSYPS